MILGIVGLVLGIVSRNSSPSGMNLAGIITSAVGTFLSLLILIVIVGVGVNTYSYFYDYSF